MKIRKCNVVCCWVMVVLICLLCLSTSVNAFSTPTTKKSSTNIFITKSSRISTTSSSTKIDVLSFFNRQQEELSVIPGVGVDGCKLPSPSKINTYPKPVQAKIFFSIFAALFLGTDALSTAFDSLTMNYEWFQS